MLNFPGFILNKPIPNLLLITEYVLRFLEMMSSHKNHNIKFHYLVSPFHFTKRTRLKSSLENLFIAEKKEFDSLNFIFCSDAYLLKINREFLNHNYYTDIITFNLSNNENIIVGEIYISVERVMANAKELGESFSRELQRVIFHGALHLCGYKDKTKKDILLMRNKEDEYLKIHTGLP